MNNDKISSLNELEKSKCISSRNEWLVKCAYSVYDPLNGDTIASNWVYYVTALVISAPN